MNLHPIHQTPEDRLAENSQGTLSAIEKNSRMVEEMAAAIGNLNLTDLAIHLVSVSQNLLENKQKLEEVKSAQLATNLTLKRVIKVIEAIPQTDMTTTQGLLKDILTEQRKEHKVKINLV